MTLTAELEKQLFDAADQLWTNSGLLPSEYSTPVLALIFLRYVEHKFSLAEQSFASGIAPGRRGRLSKNDCLTAGVIYLTDTARFEHLLEQGHVGKSVNQAMEAIEAANPELKDVLPKTYGRFEEQTLSRLLTTFANIPMDVDGDVFGRVYEYFLGRFAPRTLQKGGEFFTPVSVVKLIAEVVEPFHGRILDPACGSGGMFVQSARFVSQHQKHPSDEISVFGIEKSSRTLRLTKMNLAVHGLAGDIREANTYYEDPHDCVGNFDFVMANPPFNQGKVDKERIKSDMTRFPFGLPTADNANYLWIQLFYSALNSKGRAGFVMANSAGDARGSERDIRRQLIESGVVDVIVSLSTNFFYTVTLPATLWFFDKGKMASKRKDTILFVDAREVYESVDRSHKEFSLAQVEFLANIVRLYRGDLPEALHGGEKLLKAQFPKMKYVNVAGLCKVATRQEVASNEWSLNPGRYVGTQATEEEPAGDFRATLLGKLQKLAEMASEAHLLEERIQTNTKVLFFGNP